jgi:hypothetical protein
MRGQGTSWMPPAGGMVLWEGPSRLDGSPIVALATFRTNNRKTGPMIQTWILPAEEDPLAAVRSGADAAVCGGCPLRGVGGKGRACYVNVLKGGPWSVWRSWRAGQYPGASDRLLGLYVAGRPVRLGAYGDPVAVPLGIWTTLLGWAGGHTGYTHQWSRMDSQDYASILMASVETPEQRREAAALGWRTYRIMGEAERPARGETWCPASAEQGHRISCSECLLCDGAARSGGHQRSVAIRAHGNPAVLASARRQFTVLNSPSL